MADNKKKTVGNEIIFRMGEETGIVIEKTKEQFEHSLFKEQYRQAFGIVNDIIVDSSVAGNEAPISNIVAFCGDRGEGKTSALITVKQMLSNEDVYKTTQKVLTPISSLSIKPDEFYAMDVIDPSFFDEQHNILELVLGQMYEMVKRDDDDNNSLDKVESGEYRPLLEKFAVAKRCLSALEPQESMYDAMSELSTLAASMRLRKAIDSLFATFLAYFKKKKLIISIDDIDLNMTGAYEMTEDIRKYLSNNHCIILMAVKVEQLTTAIRAAIRRDIKDVQIVSDVQIADMAHKYMTKFIPEINRVIMPSPEDVSEKTVFLKDRDNKEIEGINHLPAKEIIVRLIFNKTRFLFYNSRSNSPIVPLNLRNMRHLIGILVEMPDIYEGQETRNDEKWIHNKNVFKNYFYKSWTSNLSKNDQEFADQLAKFKDIISTNKFVVSYLAQSIKVEKDSKIDGIFNLIIEKENRSHNISVGDVYYVIRQIETISTDKDVNTLLFFVRSYYSMRLYELYDMITTQQVMTTNLSGVNDEVNQVTIYKYDSLYEGTNILQKFLNGSYFSYASGTLINDTSADDSSADKHRDSKAVNGKMLGELIQQCNSHFAEYRDYKEKIRKEKEEEEKKKAKQQNLDGNQENPSENEVDKEKNRLAEKWKSYEMDVQRCEYFILTTTHQLRTNRDTKDRTAINPPFIGVYDSITRQYIAFDFLAIFYNLVNLRYAFKRFGTDGDQFFQNVISQEWSITSQLFLSTSDDKTWPATFEVQPLLEKYHRLLSDSCIRVSEVQQSIVEELTKNKLCNKHKTSSANTYKLYSAYEDIQKLDISLYPYSDADEKYRIHFGFLKPIIDFLKAEDNDKFDEIYFVESVKKATAEEKKIFYKYFKFAYGSHALVRPSIIKTLRKGNEQLPESADAFWKEILPEWKYKDKDEWINACIAAKDILYKYVM